MITVSYTTNYSRNPSFQMNLEGYSQLLDASIALDTTNVLYGNQSCVVGCPGNNAGEGCSTSGGIIPGHSTCAASCYITGSGSVTVYAVTNPGGIIVTSVPVVLTGQWQRIKLEGIECYPGQTLFLTVRTTVASQCQFWLSGIQVEDTSPCHPYCDGDQDGCEWAEGFWGGISVCLYENPVAAVSASSTASNRVPILIQGERFYVSSVSSSRTYDSLVFAGGSGPAGAVTDFAVFGLTDPDPAQAYVSWNNAGTLSSTGGTYTRIWSVFYPPQEYLVSNGDVLYERAAYGAVGWKFASVPANGTVNLARVQAEVLPVTTGYSQPSPSAFDPPRAIHSVIKPDRLNYCTNPSIEVSVSGWTAVGEASLSQDGTVSVGDIIEYDDNILTAGTHSLKVVVNSNGDGAEISIPDLITGYTYIASVYVRPGQGMENIVLSVADGETSVLATGGTGYGTGEYDEGPYGGIDPASDLPENTWFRINCIFTASSDTEILSVTSSSAEDISYPADMWVDAVLIEAGEVLSFYFDGSFGVNYSWETGGSAGLARSYYYDQQAIKQQAVLNVLAGHIPLGITAGTPEYSVPPAQ